MLKRLSDWIEERTGYRRIVHEALDEPIPGGARWRYVFGSCLTAAFLIQALTGVLMMTTYSPSATTAWGSVYYITHVMDFGWFVRGLHHFGAQAMVVLLGLHLAQVVLAGAYRSPREFNWWFGLALLFVTMGLGLTGYLLPWDQKGYWATKVATNIMGNAPLIGPTLQKLLVGGSEYGNQTLTRFYTLHVAVLPALLVGLLVIHIALFRKHGVTHPPQTRDLIDRFWPKQVFFDTVAITLVVAIVAGLTLWEQFRGHGIPLDAPADPASSDYPARPEWYFLSLFQLLNQLPLWLQGFSLSASQIEVLGTVVIPGTILLILVLLPFLDRLFPRRLAHFLAVGFLFALAGGALHLTWQALATDAADPAFAQARARAAEAGRRAQQLASTSGIPPQGASSLLRDDPLTRGHSELSSHCLGCHVHNGQGLLTTTRHETSPAQRDQIPDPPAIDGLTDDARRALAAALPTFRPTSASANPTPSRPNWLRVEGVNQLGESVLVDVSSDGRWVEAQTSSRQTASDLAGFGTSAWLRGLLENPSDDRYFGKVQAAGGMRRWKKNSKLTAEELDQIVDFFARHVSTIPEDLPASEWIDQPEVQAHPAYRHFAEGGECATCHADWVFPNEEAPNLYGWGSAWWTRRMILRPQAPHFYGFLDESDRMPSFAGKLTDAGLHALIRYLRGDYIPPDHPQTASSDAEPGRQPTP
ncbi:MAG: hypothetical protein KatS3mg108_3320 [Isosphaeraceae bacterium]|nr:MAG: hypothetical protein KatS3mg108_3320 [Isosphaeraceae bacterium]